jgi:hypothetical protein
MKVGIVFLLMINSLLCFGGVKEKKARRGYEKVVNEEITLYLKEKLGSKIKVVTRFDSDLETNDYVRAGRELKKTFVPMFKKVLSDKDYVEEIKKMKSITFHLKHLLKKYPMEGCRFYSGFEKTDTALTVVLDGFHMMHNNDSKNFRECFQNIW